MRALPAVLQRVAGPESTCMRVTRDSCAGKLAPSALFTSSPCRCSAAACAQCEQWNLDRALHGTAAKHREVPHNPTCVCCRPTIIYRHIPKHCKPCKPVSGRQPTIEQFDLRREPCALTLRRRSMRSHACFSIAAATSAATSQASCCAPFAASNP